MGNASITTGQGSVESYRRQIATITSWLLVAHIPLFSLVAWMFGTSQMTALFLGGLLAGGGVVSRVVAPASLTTLSLQAFALISSSGLLIHLSNGMIEWHFHIFVALAYLALTGSVVPVGVAAATAAVHHLAGFFLFPRSVFNYEASLGIVLFHAAFVVVETLAVGYVAYRFGRILQAQGSTLVRIMKLSEDLLGATGSLEEQATNLNVTATTQTSSVQSTASSLNQITQTLSVSLEAVRAALVSSNESHLAAKASKDSTLKTISDFESLADVQNDLVSSMNRSVQNIDTIFQDIQAINEKTGVINEIVFQTKLLSFNASVEAARAGEAGKGFSIVAEEVGNLARMSGTAALEIDTLLEASLKKVSAMTKDLRSEAGRLSNASRLKTEEGMAVASESRESLETLEGQIVKLNERLVHIERSSREQTEAVHVINAAMTTIDEGTRESAVAIDNTATGTRAVKNVAHELQLTLTEMRAALGADRKAS